MAMFNEVFLTDVFVPDDCVVGPADRRLGGGSHDARQRAGVDGRRARRSVPGTVALLGLAEARGRLDDPLVVDRVGGLLVEAHALAALATRTTLRALGGGQPGPEASVRKLLGVEHEQDVQEVGLDLLGPDAAVSEGDGAAWTGGFLGNRALSIAGGTSEIQRNVIAERLLGLPKDP